MKRLFLFLTSYFLLLISAFAQCDTIFSFPTVDNQPSGLAYDGKYFYCSGSPLIYKYDLNGQVYKTIPNPATNLFGEYGGDMDFDGTYLWKLVQIDGKIYKLDTSNGNIVAQFRLPYDSTHAPGVFGCAYDKGYLWITEFIDRALMRIDANTGSLVDSFTINREVLPLKVINGELYGIQIVDNFAPYDTFQLLKFDRTTGNVIDSMPWCLRHPLGLAYADEHLWGVSGYVYGGTRRIYKFDTLSFILNGIGEIDSEQPGISIYPNPFSTTATIRINAPTQEHTYAFTLYDVLGRIMKQIEIDRNTVEIKTEDLPNGIYFYQITNDKQPVARGKIVKQ